MNIAIDFDNTWTVDPDMWQAFRVLAELQGHSCIIATNRYKWSRDMDRWMLPVDMTVIYCGGEYKDVACKMQGWKIDVWIDDTPRMIQPSLLINVDSEL